MLLLSPINPSPAILPSWNHQGKNAWLFNVSPVNYEIYWYCKVLHVGYGAVWAHSPNVWAPRLSHLFNFECKSISFPLLTFPDWQWWKNSWLLSTCVFARSAFQNGARGLQRMETIWAIPSLLTLHILGIGPTVNPLMFSAFCHRIVRPFKTFQVC